MVGSFEPYWQTNTSFSPPPPRWDYRFQSEGPQYGSNDSSQLFGSTSSNSKESRSWLRGGYHPTHQYSASESGVIFFSSPSDTSLIQPWTPPSFQGMNIDDFETSTKRDQTSERLSFTLTMEGTSMVPDGVASISSRSDASEFEHIGKLLLSSSTPRNFSARIHPLSLPVQASASPASRFAEHYADRQSDTHRFSSGSSSIDLTDISEPYESDFPTRASSRDEVFKCGLCDRLLSQRSPWSSRLIVKSGDMPVTAVLSCGHVFHAECLEQTTPKSYRSDPPCPLCSIVKGDNSSEQRAFPKLRNAFPRLRPFTEEDSSRNWGCVQAGDSVDGALHTQRSILLLNRGRIKKNLSLKGNSSKDLSGKLKKTSSYPLHLFGGKFVDHGTDGCSKAAGPSMK